MALPAEPVTLSVEEIIALNEKLSKARHDINNKLALIVAAVELIRYKPQVKEQMLAVLAEQPKIISDSIKEFSCQFERAVGITRP